MSTLSENLLPDPAAILCSTASDGGGFVDLDGDGRLWQPSGRVFFHTDTQAPATLELEQAARHFFLPRRFENPFGFSSTADFDDDDLLAIRTADALHNTVHAENDYRVLQPRLITDANGNRSEVAFDALGMVTGSAVMGKTSENAGDNLIGFRADLNATEIARFYDDPKGVFATEILAQASARIVYAPDKFYCSRQPAFSATLTRETHSSDLTAGQHSKILCGFSYVDGFGRAIQKTMQAEPEHNSAPRWIASGWTIYNNKGKPVRQYEPFFEVTHQFVFDHRAGVSPILFYDPVGRVAATLHPDHSFEKTVFDPWRQENWDANDNVLISHPENEADIGAFFRRLPQSDYLPSWHDMRITGALGYEAQHAARKAAVHGGTPGVGYADALGRTMLSAAHNRTVLHSPAGDEFYSTRIHFDIQGNQQKIFDARNRLVVQYDYDLRGTQLHRASMDAGQRWLLNDVAGKSIRAWDSRRHQFRTAYDVLRRATDNYLREDHGEEMLIGRTVYGETQSHPDLRNLRGKVVQIMDQSGVMRSDMYDFKGNLLQSERQLAQEYKHTLDWAHPIALEEPVYTSQTRYDAINRPIKMVSPDNSVIRPAYNAAGLLERITAQLDGSAASTAFIKHIAYDAKGQRTLIVYGNGTSTHYRYDAHTFRLLHLATVRDHIDSQLQDLHYSYDAVGNITHIRDNAQQNIYFRNRRVEPSNDYSYDAVYRLIAASGREHVGPRHAPTPHSADDSGRINLLLPGDGDAMARYVEQYFYDAVGNIRSMQHRGSDAMQAGWTRSYIYDENSQLESGRHNNRLSGTQLGEMVERYRYDDSAGLHGNITAMPHLSMMRWDYRDQLQATSRQHVNHGAGIPETTWYVYDSDGQRIRKITEHPATERQAPGQQAPTRAKERIYLGGMEFYREYLQDGNTVKLERTTLHIVDGIQRVALVETLTHGNDDSSPPLLRYQFGNHLGSSSLELDEQAQVISYEEYSPYGSTTYQALKQSIKAIAKRYRYTNKERDQENGFYYHGARYFAPWLGRWTACDPSFKPEFSNAYAYVRSNPVVYHDPNGKDWTRFWGGVRAVGGLAQTAGGVIFAVGTAETGIGIAAGLAVAAHGLSDYEAGVRQMRSGRDEKSITQMGISSGLQVVGVEEHNAESAATAADITLGFVNPTGPITGGPRAALAFASGAQRVQAATQVVQYAPAAVSVMAHSASTIQMMSSVGDAGSSQSSGSSSSSEPSSAPAEPNSTPAEPSSSPAEPGSTPAEPGNALSEPNSTPATGEQNYTPNPDIQPYNRQIDPATGNRPAGMQAHHPEQQATLSRSIANYSKYEDPTLLMSIPEHQATFKAQAAQRATGATLLTQAGSPAALEEAAQIMTQAGVSPATAGQTVIEHSNYLFSLTPLNEVDEVLMCIQPPP